MSVSTSVCLCECSTGDVFDKKSDDPTQLIATLQATQLVGIVSLMYGMLLHTDAPARGDTPPPPLAQSTVTVVRSAFSMVNHIARLHLPLLQVHLRPPPSNSIWPYLSSDLVRSDREYC